MSYRSYVGGKIIVTVGGDFNTYSDGNITFNAAKKITFTGEEDGVKFGEPKDAPPFSVYENKIFTACIQFYRSKEQSHNQYGNKDNSYKGEFGFDKFDKTVCAEGLIEEYQQLNDVVPFDEPIKGLKKYICSYLSIWPPNVEGNLDNKKSKVTLYIKAEKAITQLAPTGEIEFIVSNPNITINGNTILSLTIGAEPQPLTIECKGTFANDETIIAKAKGENQILGKLIIKSNSIIYKTIIQPVELSFGMKENFAIPDIQHTTFIQDLVKDFNNRSFNQAYIYGELAPKTKKIALSKSEFETAGLLATNAIDNNLYLKMNSGDDTSTRNYNAKIEQRYAASLSNQTAKQTAEEDLQKTVKEVLVQFDKKYSFKKDGDIKYTLKQYQNKIATTAWNDTKVQKAYKDYLIAKTKYDSFGGDGIELNKNKKLHFFYTNDIHGARTPEATVLAYSELSSGVAHIFDAGLKSPDANTTILHELGHSLSLEHSFEKEKLGTYAIKEKGKRYQDDIQKEIEELEGNKKTGNIGEIKRLEKQKKNIEKSNLTSVNQNEIQTLANLKSKYTMLQNCLNSKENFSIENFESFFIRDLNLNSDSTMQKEANSLDIVSDRTYMTVADIDIQINEANQKLEKLKIEKKSAEETKILSKSKSQSTTQENYMDYYQDSNNNTNLDFERKSYYQWQWAEIQKTGIQKTYFKQIK